MFKGRYIFGIIFSFLFLVGIADALTISPMRYEIQVEPGTTVNKVIQLFNEQDYEKVMYFSTENFEAGKEAGKPVFIGANGGLSSWITTSVPVVTIPPGGSVEVPFLIEIPEDAKPGGHFAAVFLGSSPPAGDGGEVSVGGRLGSLILLTVKGDFPEESTLLDFNINEKVNNFFPVSFGFTFQNGGGLVTKPQGEVLIKNIFGKKVDQINPNPGRGNVLPGTVRDYKFDWLGSKGVVTLDDMASGEINEFGFFDRLFGQFKEFRFGYYTAELDLKIENGDTFQKSVGFFFFPWQALILIFVIGFVLFYGVYGFFRDTVLKRIKKKNKQDIDEDEDFDE